MARFELEWLPGDALEPIDEDIPDLTELESTDWTDALAQVLGELGVGDDLPRVLCELSPTGDVHVQRAGAPQLRIRATTEEVDLTPALEAPSAASLEPGQVPALEGPGAPDRADDLADAALELLLAAIAAESGAVLVHAPERGALRFAAARGPKAHDVLDIEIPESAGIAGLVRRTGASLTVREASGSAQHYSAVDRAVGYRTRGVLAVPIRRPGGPVSGVLELLNPAGGAFRPWHEAMAADVAAALGRRS